jgi:Ulp1 family protease
MQFEELGAEALEKDAMIADKDPIDNSLMPIFKTITPFGISCTWEAYERIFNRDWLTDVLVDIIGKYVMEKFTPKSVNGINTG